MYPVYETDLCVRTENEELLSLPTFPSAACISKFVAHPEELMGRMNPTAYGSTEPQLQLVGKIFLKSGENCRETSERKPRTQSHDDLIDLVTARAMQREDDSHIDKYMSKHLRRKPPAERDPSGRSPQPHSNLGKGLGGQLKQMKEPPPPPIAKGPVIFSTIVLRADCDGRSSCLLQLQRKQKTKDSQEVKQQDHFRRTIRCGNPAGGLRSSAPATSGRGTPNPTPKGEQQGKKRIVSPSSPSASAAERSENAKKRKLNWHSKCL